VRKKSDALAVSGVTISATENFAQNIATQISRIHFRSGKISEKSDKKIVTKLAKADAKIIVQWLREQVVSLAHEDSCKICLAELLKKHGYNSDEVKPLGEEEQALLTGRKNVSRHEVKASFTSAASSTSVSAAKLLAAEAKAELEPTKAQSIKTASASQPAAQKIVFANKAVGTDDDLPRVTRLEEEVARLRAQLEERQRTPNAHAAAAIEAADKRTCSVADLF
jgi:hypothetical protein